MKFLYMVFLWHGTVQYRIKDAYNFLFKVRDPQGMLRDLSEATMRLVVGDRSINEVNQATQEKEKLIYQAREEYNKRIPQAR
jgi:modulator of FtsH protease HflK